MPLSIPVCTSGSSPEGALTAGVDAAQVWRTAASGGRIPFPYELRSLISTGPSERTNAAPISGSSGYRSAPENASLRSRRSPPVTKRASRHPVLACASIPVLWFQTLARPSNAPREGKADPVPVAAYS